MANLLKQISITYMFLAMGFAAHCQNFEHRISIPVVSYYLTNIPQFDKGLNKNYINKLYLPNFRYEISYKQKLNLALESYYFDKHTNNPRSMEGEIRNIRINSFLIFIGYNVFSKTKLKVKTGIGFAYHHSWVGSYLDYYPQVWEGWICYEYNKFGPMFWSSLDYEISKSFSVRLNLRYNPMFKPFERDNFKDCKTEHNHDRLNYGVGQLAVGYKF